MRIQDDGKIRPRCLMLAAGVAAMFIAGSASAQSWVTFVDETSTRFNASPALSTTDAEEKDYTWGDFDQDGDLDLVAVRKQPFTSPGRRANVLFMNVNGVLTDQTSTYAAASDVVGDQGFLTPTNDRDVIPADVNGDGWIDLVTATTISEGQPKHISHPRVYINLGDDINGNWLGFRHEDARIPQFFSFGSNPHPIAPRFCAVAAGDVDNDGDLDLYFGDYDSAGAGGSTPEAPGDDANDRLLINNGNGFYTDQSQSRMTSEMLVSAFSAAAAIIDINNDGKRDIIKQTALAAPQRISVSYNGTTAGNYSGFQILPNSAPYFISVGDLNNDNRPDVVVSDDGQDTYILNTGLSGGQATWNQISFSYESGGDDGFAGGSRIADLNNDGFNDVMIADVDVDIPGCGRRGHIFRNLGNTPNVTLREQQSSGKVANIPTSMLVGTYDFAPFDINGDGWLDLVIGRCNSTQVWINQPPIGIAFTYPQGLPGTATPGETTPFEVTLNPIGAVVIQPGSAKLFASVDNGPFTEYPLTVVSGNTYAGELPEGFCTRPLDFYITGQLTGGQQFADPSTAPAQSYSVSVIDGEDLSIERFEGDANGWTTTADNLLYGAFEQVAPNGTIFGGGLAAPNEDAGAGQDVKAFVTGNGTPGGQATTFDLDGGPVKLTSPVFDLDGTDAVISYAFWFFCDDAGNSQGDFFVTEVSNDGGASWVQVSSRGTVSGGGSSPAWETVSFIASDFVTPSSQMRVRFTVADAPNNSVTEGGVDQFQIRKYICNVACDGDANGSGVVDFGDLNMVLGAWQTSVTPFTQGDLTGDGEVDFSDLNEVLSNWGNEC